MLDFLKNGLAATLAAPFVVTAPAIAADLKIGFKAEVTSADPHILNGQNRNVWAHVYDSLVYQDETLRPSPRLAVSWRTVNPTTWEFKLRPNVNFHNGTPFTAEDAKYSIERAMNLSGPRTFRNYLKDVESISVAGPLTLQVKTKTPSPTLPDNLGLIAIVPKSLGSSVTEESFANGKSAIGTGPYKYGSWVQGQRVTVAKNDSYWGPKEPWDNVTFQFIPREPARASALLSGSVDLIDGATSNMTDSFNNSNKIDLASVTSYMLNYIALDQFRDNSPYIKSNEGAPLAKNPLKDLKVRQALMHAVNREGIIKFLMKGDATATEQLVPQAFFGYDASIKLPAHDLSKAKALLAEAGYPNGFRMTLHCSNNRYVNDAKMCEAVAQVFNQVGVKTEVATMPFSVYQTRYISGGANGETEFSAFMLGNGFVTGDSLTGLTSILRTRDKETGLGANNYTGYSNKQVDALIDKAAQTMDEKARESLQKQATKLALDDASIIPLVHINAGWAMRKGLTVKPRADGFTMAMDVRPSKGGN
ncbi:ABC transporter substrate-binding protein [Herbaspirillum sp. GCM10030257]|uniref:ABC transporter substrate-binding protein n=1 Tax=Herbaspirillum sp. GCM10030257 TaxID=3273393 RepID=UPI003606A073